MPAYLECHPEENFQPETCLDLPGPEGCPSARDVIRRSLPDGSDIYVLTKTGRKLLTAHLAVQEPWVQYPDEFLQEAKNKNFSIPTSIASWQFHFLNLLVRFPDFAFRRSDLAAIQQAFFESFENHQHTDYFPHFNEDNDVIQYVNKFGQFGLQHNAENLETESGKKITHYWLKTPYEIAREKRIENTPAQPALPECVDCVPVKDKVTTEDHIIVGRRRTIEYLKRNYIDVPPEDWTDNGHTDPHDKNSQLVVQPSKLNRFSKDKYKFNELGLVKCPSVTELLKNPDKYYSKEEQETLKNNL